MKTRTKVLGIVSILGSFFVSISGTLPKSGSTSNANLSFTNSTIGGYIKDGDNKKQIVSFASTVSGDDVNNITEYGIKVYSDSECSSALYSKSSTNVTHLISKEGRFYTVIGDDEEISKDTTYYAKAYAVVGGTTYSSDVMNAKGNDNKEYTFSGTYQISVSASTGGTVTGSGNYSSGDSCTVVATASTGYTFDGWYENDTKIEGADATYTFTVSASRTLTAKFKNDYYKEIEYIQTSGTQCIDTTFKNTSFNFKVEIDTSLTFGSSANGIYGVETNIANKESQFYVVDKDLSIGNNYAFNYPSPTVTQSTNRRTYIFDAGNKTGSAGDITFSYSTLGNVSNAKGNHALSAIYNSSSNQFTYFSQMKIYECKIWQDDVLLRHFVPCILISNIPSTKDSKATARTKDTLGMWDKVNNLFYGNSGSGDFTAP